MNQINQSAGSKSRYVFLIEDDESMRYAIRDMLQIIGYRVTVFSSAAQFLEYSIVEAPAVVVTDMVMPHITGVELQAELIKKGRNIPIIFISGESTVAQSITAMKQGALEFLIKPFEREELLAAIVRGLDQDSKNMQSYVQKAAFEESLKALSPREREVFELLGLGFNNAQIQDKLQISLPTAKQYKSEVMRKLNLRSLAQLLNLKNQSRN